MSNDSPTIPADIDLPPDAPQWPKTVGIISIVWGGLGLLCGVCGGVGIAMQSTMSQQIEQQMGGPMPDILKPTLVQYASMGIGTAVALLLIVAGIMLVSRTRAAGPLHLVYAVLSIVVTAIATVAGLLRLLDQAAWAKANAADPWAQNFNMPVALAATIFGLFLGVAWPLFCLVWFGIRKKNPAQGMSPGPGEA